MDNKIALRKEAVRRHLSGESQVRISRALGRSACWVRYWLTRYNPDDPDGSLQDRSRAPHQPHSHWLAETRQQALTSRQQRQSGSRPGYEHALISAEAIHYELAHLGVEPAPPPRTIHYWLKQEGLVSARQPADAMPSSKPYPYPLCRAVNDLQQLDLKGPLYLQGSAQKHYLLVVRDVCSRGVALGVAQDRRAATIAAFLVTAWQTRGLPKVLQMDNGLEFRGSNRYPRAFGLVVRLALDVGVEPLFIPPHQPWRNGGVERFNGQIQHLLLDRCLFDATAALGDGVASLQLAVNTTHRLPALNGQTPDEFIAGCPLRYLEATYDGLQRDLQLVKGWVSFIRRVHPGGRVTLCAHDTVTLDSALDGQYVLARLDVAAQRLDVYHQGQLVNSFDYLL